MKIEMTTVTKITLSELDRLDPISVILEDLGPRQGKINIECYGQAWSAYWGGMGNRTIAQFFCSCDEHYLAKNLSSIRSWVTDYDAITAKARAEIIMLRKDTELDADTARELYDKAAEICDISSLEFNSELMQTVFGDDWWYVLPEKVNHEYEYLCRIINAVKDGLRTQLPKAA